MQEKSVLNKSEHRHLFITGLVQGVGYRAWLARETQELGLNGWVRNRHNGSVEAVLVGPGKKLDIMTAKCRNGPAFSQVDKVTSATLDGDKPLSPDGITIRPTA